MNTEQLRAEFEAWIKTEHQAGGQRFFFERLCDDSRYSSMEVEWAWRAYCRSRAVLVVELPSKGLADIGKTKGAAYWHNIRNGTIDACRRAVLEAGVTVK